MTTRQKELYLQARHAGHNASEAWHSAKIVAEFEQHSDNVRITAETEQENYFDVYGKPEGYVDQFGNHHSAEQEYEEIHDSINRLGCWIVSGEFRNESGEWEMADCVGMNTGYSDPCDWRQNWYVPQLMQSALAGRKQHVESLGAY